MSLDLIPNSFWQFPSLRSSSIWGDEDNDFLSQQIPSGLSVSEDDKSVYVEAVVPGVDPKEIEITLKDGVMWISGESREDEKDKGKKYYRRASRSFSYKVAIPGDVDQNVEPEATCKNGVMKVTFTKSPKAQPKKIQIKNE